MNSFKLFSKLGIPKISGRFKKRFFGFGMIEVLVSMAIIGIIAAGTTQTIIASRRAEYDAQLRRVALMLLDDIASRMKSNRRESTYNNGVNYRGNIPNAIPSSSCVGVDFTSCTPAQMAVYDLWDWGQYVHALLPLPNAGPIGKITLVTAQNGSVAPTFTVSIYWTGSPNVQQPQGAQQQASLSFSTPL